jgi:hypothetical protein
MTARLVHFNDGEFGGENCPRYAPPFSFSLIFSYIYIYIRYTTITTSITHGCPTTSTHRIPPRYHTTGRRAR